LPKDNGEVSKLRDLYQSFALRAKLVSSIKLVEKYQVLIGVSTRIAFLDLMAEEGESQSLVACRMSRSSVFLSCGKTDSLTEFNYQCSVDFLGVL
jgi:hypothetical protein